MLLRFHHFYTKFLISAVIFEIVVAIKTAGEQAYVSMVICTIFNILSFVTGFALQKNNPIGIKLVKIRNIAAIVLSSVFYLFTLIGFCSAGTDMFGDLMRNIFEGGKDPEGLSYIGNFFMTISAAGLSIFGAILCVLLLFVLAVYIVCEICILRYYSKRKELFTV